MAIQRLGGGLTPADGDDPRTFPAIWNTVAGEIEDAQSDIVTLQSDVVAVEGSAVSLGSAVSDLQVDVTALEQDKLAILSAGSDSITVDFASATPLITRSIGGAVSLTGSNYTEGVTRTVRIVGDGTARALTVPGGWKFVGQAVGTAVPVNKTVIISATSFGTAEASVVAAYAAEI